MKTLSWINTQIEWIKSFFSEYENQNSKASSRRLYSTAVIGCYLFSHIKTSLSTKTIPDISLNWIIIISLILGFNIVDSIFKIPSASEMFSKLRTKEEVK